jgi:hypothetical protein
LWFLDEELGVSPWVSMVLGNVNGHKRPHSDFHLLSGKLLALKGQTLPTSAIFVLLMPEFVLCVGLLFDPDGFIEGHSTGTVRAGDLRTLDRIKQ